MNNKNVNERFISPLLQKDKLSRKMSFIVSSSTNFDL